MEQSPEPAVPTLDRRRFVGAAGLGVTSLVLPTAASASSPSIGAASQSGLPDYGAAFSGSDTGDTVLAHWDTFSSGNQDWTAETISAATDGPRLATVSALVSIAGGISGQPEMSINTTAGVYLGTGVLSPGSGTFTDLETTGSPARTEFRFNTPSTSISLSSSPFLEWSLTAAAGHQVRAASLVLYKLRTMGTATVNVAFYGSRDDFASETRLLRVATLQQSLRLLSIGLGSVRDVDAGETLRVRMYTYGMSAVEDLRFRNYNYEGTDPIALDATRDSTSTTYQGTRASYPNALASFVGQVLNV